MRITERGNRGPVWAEFTRAQNGKAIDNMARAFHLPRPQAKAALLSMLDALIMSFDEQTLSRASLARLIELLGKNDYERILEDPILIGATSTQVIGNEALTALAGHSESSRIASRSAAAAGISEMIAEYLLPVVAAMFMGALSVRTRPGLQALARDEAASIDAAGDPPNAASVVLPVGRGSTGLFSGSTIITPTAGPQREALYRELADRLRKGGEKDVLAPARRILAEGLGLRARTAPWVARWQRRAALAMQSAGTHIQQRLRKLRSR